MATRRVPRVLPRNPFRRWVTADRFIALIGISIGSAFGIASVVNLDSAHRESYWIYALTFVTIVLATALAIIIFRMGVLPRPLTEEEMLGVARKFAGLLHRQIQFEAAVSACVRHLFASGTTPDNTYNTLLQELQSQYATLIASICEAAAYVITLKHDRREDTVSVNIKVFEITDAEPAGAVYLVQKRSANSDTSRDESDEQTKRREFRVAHHMIYRGFFDDHAESMVDGVCVIDDIEDYINKRNVVNEKRIQNNQVTYKEPSEKVLRFYRSCIVAPIVGQDDLLSLMKHSAPHAGGTSLQLGEGRCLLGILCIDSKKKAFFDRGYDVEIMKQLASHAFSAMRALYSVRKLRDDILRKINEAANRGSS
jgi:hypothetical protein